MDKVKQVIVIRSDLRNITGQKIRTGKIIAQACHASIAFLSNLIREQININESDFPSAKANRDVTRMLTVAQKEWITGSFFKICVVVNSEKELLDIFEKSKTMGVGAHLITDQGHTEFNGVPTNTCLALGPDYSSKIDPITGHLKLF